MCWREHGLYPDPGDTMGDLRSLQYLHLVGPSSNGLWGKPSRKSNGLAVAADICKLTTLIALHISGGTCEMLELCDQLSELVSKLVKLKLFHIRDFQNLESLPDAVQSMVHLEEMLVCDCEPIKILPSFITLFFKTQGAKIGWLVLLGKFSSIEHSEDAVNFKH
jgi:hypothetical protein